MGFSQLRIDKTPRSFAKGQRVEQLQIMNLPKPDMQQIEQEDEENASLFKPRRFGVNIPVGVDFFSQAKKVTTDDGTIWFLRLEAEDAEAIAFYSSDFYLPEGGELYLYNSDKSQVIGAFTSLNNHESRTFAAELLMGDNIVIEYYQPSWQSELASLEVTEICYAYRDMDELPKDASGSCNVNVNCPEGNNWRDVQRSVCRISIKGGSYYYWCSGTLVNNTSQDKSPYVLTAAHCVEESSSSDYNQFMFYFNYESSSCTGSTSSTTRTLTGASLKAYDNTYGSGSGKSDFCLVLLNNAIPQNYNAYWSGWSRSTSAAQSGVGIHHPSGDIKKISTFTTPAQSVSGSYYSGTTHWKITWAQTQTNYGITEGGSSGSAIFNENGLLVGTLSGGTSACNVSNSQKVDWYGKMSYHWTSNGTADNSRLAPWLDPTNSGVTELAGRNYTETNALTSIDETNNPLVLYPNPAEKEVTISLMENGKETLINIINAQGNTVYTTQIQPNENHKTLNIQHIPAGLYMVEAISEGKLCVKKLIIK
jgi:hypothetical protein